MLQQTDGRQHVTAVSLNKQYTDVQKVDSQAEPTFETQLVFKARLLFTASEVTTEGGIEMRLLLLLFIIRGPASISTFKSDPRLVFEARLVFKDLQ